MAWLFVDGVLSKLCCLVWLFLGVFLYGKIWCWGLFGFFWFWYSLCFGCWLWCVLYAVCLVILCLGGVFG